MDKQSKQIIGLFSRYFLLIILGLGNLYLIYKILTHVTIWATSNILSLISQTTVSGNILLFKGNLIVIAPACVAGAAFYLLFLLIFTTLEIKPKKRLLIALTATLILLALNVLRIVFLATIISKPYFYLTHWIFWNLISTVFVVGTWFTVVKIYKIKSIPVYSDFIFLKSLIKSVKNSKRSKKY